MYNLLVEDDWHAACKRKAILIDGHMRRAEAARECINHVRPLSLFTQMVPFTTLFRALRTVCVVTGQSQ